MWVCPRGMAIWVRISSNMRVLVACVRISSNMRVLVACVRIGVVPGSVRVAVMPSSMIGVVPCWVLVAVMPSSMIGVVPCWARVAVMPSSMIGVVPCWVRVAVMPSSMGVAWMVSSFNMVACVVTRWVRMAAMTTIVIARSMGCCGTSMPWVVIPTLVYAAVMR